MMAHAFIREKFAQTKICIVKLQDRISLKTPYCSADKQNGVVYPIHIEKGGYYEKNVFLSGSSYFFLFYFFL